MIFLTRIFVFPQKNADNPKYLGLTEKKQLLVNVLFGLLQAPLDWFLGSGSWFLGLYLPLHNRAIMQIIREMGMS